MSVREKEIQNIVYEILLNYRRFITKEGELSFDPEVIFGDRVPIGKKDEIISQLKERYDNRGISFNDDIYEEMAESILRGKSRSLKDFEMWGYVLVDSTAGEGWVPSRVLRRDESKLRLYFKKEDHLNSKLYLHMNPPKSKYPNSGVSGGKEELNVIESRTKRSKDGPVQFEKFSNNLRHNKKVMLSAYRLKRDKESWKRLYCYFYEQDMLHEFFKSDYYLDSTEWMKDVFIEFYTLFSLVFDNDTQEGDIYTRDPIDIGSSFVQSFNQLFYMFIKHPYKTTYHFLINCKGSTAIKQDVEGLSSYLFPAEKVKTNSMILAVMMARFQDTIFNMNILNSYIESIPVDKEVHFWKKFNEEVKKVKEGVA